MIEAARAPTGYAGAVERLQARQSCVFAIERIAIGPFQRDPIARSCRASVMG